MKDTNEIVEPMVVEPFNQPPTATLSPTSGDKSPSSVGSSHFFVQHQHTGRVGSGQGNSSNSHPGSIPSLSRSGGSASQITASHTRGISSSLDVSSTEIPMVQTRSDLAAGIIRPRKEFQLQSSHRMTTPSSNPRGLYTKRTVGFGYQALMDMEAGLRYFLHATQRVDRFNYKTGWLPLQ